MKLWQKLMPVATAATAVVCVAPMASCSESFLVSTTNKDFKPEQHGNITSPTQPTVTEEYFKDAKNACNDYCYLASVKEKDKETTEKETYDNYKLDFSVSMSLTIGEEKKDVEIDGNKYTGYMVSGKMKFTENKSFDLRLDEPSKITYNKISSEYSFTTTVSFTNCFAFLTTTEAPDYTWSLHLYGIKSLNKAWVANETDTNSSTVRKTYVNGNIEAIPNSSSNYFITSANEFEDPTDILNRITGYPELPSYVFAKVAKPA